MSVSVVVPASSANLGPGFDAFGLALSLSDDLTAEEIPSGLEIEVSGEGADEVPRDSSHVVVHAMEAAFDHLGERPSGLRLTCTNRIPHARGLGSSSAAIVGGLALAAELVQKPLDKDAMFTLAARIEGHPDNVAAAVYGGFTIAWSEPAGPQAVRLDADLTVSVFVPPVQVSTNSARRLLPARVPHADAAFNAGRAALLVAALQGGRPDLLLPATDDALHQGYRAEAMPMSYELVQELRSTGIPAVISGAGPTVLAFGRGVAGPDGWIVHELDIDAVGVRPV